VENLVYIDLLLGRCLHEGAVIEVPAELVTLVLSYNALILKITLVTNQAHGNIISILHSEDLFSEVLEIVEGALRGD